MSVLLWSAGIGSVLVAGIFYAFSTFVMAALARLSPGEGIRAMQAINVVVINPWAMGAMFGTALLGAVAVVAAWFDNDANRTVTVVAAVLYLVGCVGVTGTRNVPLNDRLAAVEAADPAAHELWRGYLVDWTRWNHVRTFVSLAAGVAFLLAMRRP